MPLLDQIRAEKLINLARSRFDHHITDAELNVSRDSASSIDAAVPKPDALRPEIRPEFARWLATDPEAVPLVDPKGLRFVGVTLAGKLNLMDCSIGVPLVFKTSTLQGGIDLSWTVTRDIGVFDCVLNGAFTAAGIEAHGPVMLRGNQFSSSVGFARARIKNDLDLDNSKLELKNEVALTVDGAEIGGNLFLRGTFTSSGTIRLVGANGTALLAALAIAVATPWVPDRSVLAGPAALAALEGHYHTYNPDGTVDTSWDVVAWPNAAGDGTAWAITIPHVLSLLETHSWSDKVQGLNSFAPQDRPPVLIPFYGFRIMAGAGAVIFLLALWGLWLAVRGKMTAESIVSHKWFLRFTIFCGFLPYIAVWTGWWTREIGRQPWLVYGMMTTAQGTSRMGAAQEIFWMIGYVGFELMVWGGTWYFFAKAVRKGPDMESPVVHGRQPAHGHAETHASFAYAKAE